MFFDLCALKNKFDSTQPLKFKDFLKVYFREMARNNSNELEDYLNVMICTVLVLTNVEIGIITYIQPSLRQIIEA